MPTYEYPRPALTTDVALFRVAGELQLLLIRRKGEPFQGMWALPGGFLDEGEDLDACARRELEEETGVVGAELHPLANFSRPGRDPRGWTVTAAYVAMAPPGAQARAGDDAAEAQWFAAGDLPALAFDHDEIVARAIVWLHEHASVKGLDPSLLPPVAVTAR